MKQFYFISGLPRSGTTLLSAILNQNPEFHASISGPLARFTRAIIAESSAQSGYAHQCPQTTRKEIIKGIFDNYYERFDNNVIFDTNRGWTLLLPIIKDLYPYTKVICCVRDINWILDSFEQLIRKNAFQNTIMFTESENLNVYTRAHTLMQPERTVGFAYTALKHAITSDERSMIMLVEYEQLCKQPQQMMKAIYKFIDKPYFDHDFNNVAMSFDEYDAEVMLPGLHTTRSKVEWIERETIIPPDILNTYAGMEVWR